MQISYYGFIIIMMSPQEGRVTLKCSTPSAWTLTNVTSSLLFQLGEPGFLHHVCIIIKQWHLLYISFNTDCLQGHQATCYHIIISQNHRGPCITRSLQTGLGGTFILMAILLLIPKSQLLRAFPDTSSRYFTGCFGVFLHFWHYCFWNFHLSSSL